LFRLLSNQIRIGPVGSALCNTGTARLEKFSIPASQEIVDDVCLEMYNCLQAEQTIAIRKRRFLNKYSVINNVLCHILVAYAKKELESR